MSIADLGFYPVLRARQRLRVAQKMGADLKAAVAGAVEDSRFAHEAFVEAWVVSTEGFGMPEHLTRAWLRMLVEASNSPYRQAVSTAMSVLAREVGSSPRGPHRRWMVCQLQASQSVFAVAQQREEMRPVLRQVVARTLKSGVDADAVNRWCHALELEEPLVPLMECLLADGPANGLERRALCIEIDVGVAVSIGRWPHPASAALRQLVVTPSKTDLLGRLRSPLAARSDLWTLLVRETLGRRTRLESAAAFWSRPVDGIDDALEILDHVRDGLESIAPDLERPAMDPVLDAAERLACRHDGWVDAEALLDRYDLELTRIASVLSEGVSTNEASHLRHYTRHVVVALACCRSEARPREALARVLLFDADLKGPMASRHREVLLRIAVLLERAGMVTLGGLARAGVSMLDRLAGAFRAPSGIGAPPPFDDLLRRVDSNAAWMASAHGAIEAVDQWLLGVEGVSGDVAGLYERLSGLVGPASSGDAAHMGCWLPALARDAAVARAVGLGAGGLDGGEQGIRLRGVLWELAWQLAEHASDPGRAVWEAIGADLEWDSPLAEALHTVRQVLPHEVLALCEPALRTVLQGHAPASKRSPERVTGPGPYAVEGPWWRACFGPLSGQLPMFRGGAMARFVSLLRECGDAELSALRVAEEEPGSRAMQPVASPEHRAWRSVHLQRIVDNGLDLQIGDAISVGVSRVASDVAMRVGGDAVETSVLVRELTGFLRFLSERLDAVPPSLVAVDMGRYLLTQFGTRCRLDAERWRRLFRIARSTLIERLSESAGLRWAWWCQQMLALTDLLGSSRAMAEMLSGPTPRFSESSRDEAMWRRLVGSLVAASGCARFAPIPTEALLQRLVLSDPLLGGETPSSWRQRVKVLLPFLTEHLPDAQVGGIAVTLDAVALCLADAEDAASRSKGAATTSALVLGAVPGSAECWRVDRMVRQQQRRGIRDPADLAVVGATGWALQTAQSCEDTRSRIQRCVSAHGVAVASSGGLRGFLRRSRTSRVEAHLWLERAVVEDHVGAQARHRRDSLAELMHRVDTLDAAVSAVQQEVGVSVFDRRVDIEMVQLANALSKPDKLAEIWASSIPSPADRAAFFEDATGLLWHVRLVARGVALEDPASWWERCVRRDWSGTLAGVERALAGSLGPRIHTLIGLIRPLRGGAGERTSEAG